MNLEPISTYDEASDTLSVVFPPLEQGTGIELTEHILLHIHKPSHRIVRLTLLDYSLLVQHTNFGPRTFPLTAFPHLPEAVQELIIDALWQEPLRDILHLSAHTPDTGQVVPSVSVQPYTHPVRT
ncbi:DUF2283 domain-containing protein [Candidatus Chloroploca sp. Khr17]|uniref:DUF2283 domain-containing protein n=1 Tax=Candidatus Chloroploca sp. Khr17 TaxID=2496869 RepID=UPI00196B0079|nr:DUF2283 domain-containing protein [Candidatus Chloroploca sp. Khr17]